MIYYGTVIAMTLLLYLICTATKFEKEKTDKLVVTFFFLAYLLLICIRHVRVGIDTTEYVFRFYIIKDYEWGDLFNYSEAGSEPAFLVLNKFVSMFGDERLLIIACGCLSIIPIIYLYRNEAEDGILCVSFFLVSLLFGFFFSGLRQGITIGLAVPAYYMAKNKRLLPFILFVALAFCFHRSGIMIALIYPVYYANITTKWLLFVVPAMIVIFVFRESFMELIFNVLGEDKYSIYNDITGTSGQGALTALFVIMSVYSYIILDENKAGKVEIGLRNILLLATFLHLFTPLNPVFGRINFYFILFIPVAISRINTRCKDKFKQVANLAKWVMSLFFFFHFFFLRTDSLRITNYRPFF